MGFPDHTYRLPEWKGLKERIDFDYVIKQCHKDYVDWTRPGPDEVITVQFQNGRLRGTNSTLLEVPEIGHESKTQ